MPQIIQTLAAGTDFDGTAGKGFVDFATLSPTVAGDDTMRIQVLSISVGIGIANKSNTLKNVVFGFGTSLALIDTDGNGYQFAPNADVHEFIVQQALLLPPQWNGFVIAQESVGTSIKTLVVDYNRITLEPRVRSAG